MPRPISLYKSVKREDPTIIRTKISELLGEIVEVSDKAYKCLEQCIQLITEMDTAMDTANKVHGNIVDLGVRVWNDLSISSE